MMGPSMGSAAARGKPSREEAAPTSAKKGPVDGRTAAGRNEAALVSCRSPPDPCPPTTTAIAHDGTRIHEDRRPNPHQADRILEPGAPGDPGRKRPAPGPCRP